ncbi:MAG: SPOR domain-containing protein [Spirochaetales bacterium]|nr:SPOR domain-containing protein [Spirochaetales bacterium]
MEQNKVLMVIVSMAIFFAAIVGVGIALLYPRNDTVAGEAVSGSVREFDPIEYVRRPDTAPLVTPNETDEPHIIVYGTEPEGEGVVGDSLDPLVQTVPDVSIEHGEGDAAPDPAITIVERPARDTVPRERAPVRSTATSRDATPTRSTPERSPTPQPRQIRVTEYWIQLIASPNRDRVELARTTLADHSLGGRVTTRDVDGELFYRLRVGPYASQEEAEKFLEWISDIDGFEEAYVSEEYPLRSVNS